MKLDLLSPMHWREISLPDLPNNIAYNGSAVEADSDIYVTFSRFIFVNENLTRLVDQVDGERRNITCMATVHVTFEIRDSHVSV